MSDYISRADANEALRECVRAYPNRFYCGLEAARSAIIKIPAADVREVVHGRWIKLGRIRDDGDHDFLYMCSECEYEDIHSELVKVSYCWNCGAKMESEETE